MKVICIDDSAGYKDPSIKPKFKVGDVLDAEPGMNFPEDTYFILMDGCNWLKSRFIPLSSIDETEFVRDYNKQEA